MSLQRLWELFAVFSPLSFLTIGGGQSVIADIHRQSVDVYHWMNDGTFLDIFALSRITPGPGAILATLVGWQVAGVAGAIVSSFGIFVPSSILVYGLAHVWARFKGSAWTRAIEGGLIPVAAGMILAASLTILRASEGGIWAWLVAAASTLLLIYTRVSPFLLLGGGALAFILIQPL
jgi:chromate transporter